jgi:PAS domain S-box-containing protein
MKVQKRTKKELAEELDLLRRRVSELELFVVESEQKEQALRDSQESFRRLSEAAFEGIIIHDKGKILEVNKSFAEIFGYQIPELIGKSVLELTAPECRELVLKNILSGFEKPYEAAGIRKDGTIFLGELCGKSILYEGRLVRVTTARDISERKRAEQALKQSQQKYEDLVNSIDSILWEADAESFQFSFVSKRAESLLGYPLEKWYEPTFWIDHVYPDDLEWASSFCKQAIKEKRDHKFEYRMIAADGRIVWLKDIVSVISEDNLPKYLKGVMIDITERKLAEEALKRAEERLRTVVVNSPIVLFSLNRNGVFTLSEGKGLNSLGLRPGEVVGKSVFDLYRDYPQIITAVRKTLQGEVLTEIVYVDGIFFETHFTPLLDRYQQVVGVIGVGIDVTERKLTEEERHKIEEERLKASKLESVGLLAGGIAHDFNNILMGIIGNLSLAKLLVQPQGELFQRLTEIEKASQMAKNLTQQLLTFSRGGAPIVQTTSIGELLKESVLFAVRGSNVECKLIIPDNLWQVEIDQGQMNQVINNLIINSLQAMPKGGSITVQAENVLAGVTEILPLEQKDFVKISIKDQGVGITKENLEKIFDPYFTTKQEGSGLGLATSYSIIKKHDGYITVQSEIGCGTIFYIFLPASHKKPQKRVAIQERFSSGKGKILVMDDKPIIRELVGEMLSRLGYKVDSAKDGSEAIDLYRRAKELGEPYDAVVLDLTVPGGMGGKETINGLKEIDPDVKAIVSSGYSNDPIMADFKQYGFSGVVAKPYRIDELKRILNRLIAGQKN